MSVFQDFDAKLRMTACALGCVSRKDLVARFRAVNRATQCELDRLHKWLQGRSIPRSADVLNDWALVLGSARDGSWLAACPLHEFAEELSQRFGQPVQDLLRAQAFAGRGSKTASPAAAAEPRMSGVRYLCGSYACYSAAWSPYARGKLIRGSLVIEPGRGPALQATYSEALQGKAVRTMGQPIVARRSIHMTLFEPGGEIPVFFALYLPRPPAGVLSGMIAGVTFLAPQPEPSSSRIVMIRVPASAALDATNRYMQPERGAVAADLSTLGLAPGEPDRVDKLVYEFLVENGKVDRVDDRVQALLAAELDPCHLDLDSRPARGKAPVVALTRRPG